MDLLAAAEAVSQDERFGRGLADCGQQFEFSDGEGDVVLIFLEAE